MNWTGGRLQRHAGKGNSALVSRQKSYFARARIKLQNGSCESLPFKPSFFPETSDKENNTPVGYHALQSTTRSRQKRLDEYETLAPSVARLSTLASRKSLHHCRPSGSEEIISKVHNSFNATKSAEQLSSSSADQQKGSRRREVYQFESSQAHENCTYRQPYQVDSHQSSGHFQALVLEDKRHDFVTQRDWVGLAPSRPLHMDFASHRAKEQVGKCRKITDQDRFHQEAAVKRTRVPLVRKEYFMSGALRNYCSDGRQEIKIRIGDDALVSQMSTRRSTHRPSPAPSQIDSSDSMLFDGEDELQNVSKEYLGSEHVNSESGRYMQETPSRSFTVSNAVVAPDSQSWRVLDVIEHDAEYIEARSSKFSLHNHSRKDHDKLESTENAPREVLDSSVPTHNIVAAGARAGTENAPAISYELFGHQTFRLMSSASPSVESLCKDWKISQATLGVVFTDENEFRSENVLENATDIRTKIHEHQLWREFMQVPLIESDQVPDSLQRSQAPLHTPNLETQKQIGFAENTDFHSSATAGSLFRQSFHLSFDALPVYSHLKSLPESLKEIDALAKMPPVQPAPMQDDDLLWRSFVFGGSSSQKSDTFHYIASGDHSSGTSVAAHASGSSGNVPDSPHPFLSNVRSRLNDEHKRSTTVQDTFMGSLIASPETPGPSTITPGSNPGTCALLSDDNLARNRATTVNSQSNQYPICSSDCLAGLPGTQLSSDYASVTPAILSTKQQKLFSSSPDPLPSTGSQNYFSGGMFNRVTGRKQAQNIIFHKPTPFNETIAKTVRKTRVETVHIGRPVKKRRYADRELVSLEQSSEDI